MSYNGWTNRATWLINVWFEPQSREDVQMARETFENAIDQSPDILRDFIDQGINWSELEEQFEDEDEEFEADE